MFFIVLSDTAEVMISFHGLQALVLPPLKKIVQHQFGLDMANKTALALRRQYEHNFEHTHTNLR